MDGPVDVVRPPRAVVVAMTSRLGLQIAQRLQVGQRPKLGSAQAVDPLPLTPVCGTLIIIPGQSKSLLKPSLLIQSGNQLMVFIDLQFTDCSHVLPLAPGCV